MPDKFDPYREALVIEASTVWPADLPVVVLADRKRLEKNLHAAPQQAAHLNYIRLAAGFCRRITVTPADLERLK